ncbi:hypothetical protein Y032_0635g925 [Ancylostoma ceylanicum]|nr:hypothetical protein Y032_0635g925 [Ancylostoma ceylanicum]
MDEIDVAIHLEPMAEAIKELKEKTEFCLLSLNAKVDGIAQLTNERWHCVQQILDLLLERTKPRSNCVFCTVEDNKDQHPTGRCCKYPDAVSRAVQAAALGLCERCLQPKHVEDCGVSCPICTRNHNVLLCPNRGTQAVPMYKRRKVGYNILKYSHRLSSGSGVDTVVRTTLPYSPYFPFSRAARYPSVVYLLPKFPSYYWIINNRRHSHSGTYNPLRE